MKQQRSFAKHLTNNYATLQTKYQTDTDIFQKKIATLFHAKQELTKDLDLALEREQQSRLKLSQKQSNSKHLTQQTTHLTDAFETVLNENKMCNDLCSNMNQMEQNMQ